MYLTANPVSNFESSVVQEPASGFVLSQEINAYLATKVTIMFFLFLTVH